MPTRLCNEPTCTEPAHHRGRCQTHARTHNHNINRAGYRIYRTKRWKLTRLRYLRDHPLCECADPNCHDIATDVHHRTDMAEGGDPWDPDNLQSLTHSCHSRITRNTQEAR